MYNLKSIKSIALLIASSSLIIVFQNCQPGSYQMSSQATAVNSISGTDVANSISCSLGGKNYYPGDVLNGYTMNSVVYPLTCGNKVFRTCLPSGQFDGAVPVYASCIQQCSHPDTKAAMDAGSIYYYYTKSSGVSQADCDSAKVASTCQSSTGQLLPLPPTTRFTTCQVAGQTCSYTTGTNLATPTGYSANSTVTGYQNATATYPTLCGSTVIRTCQSTGLWTGTTPLYSTCSQKCLHPDTSMPVASGTAFSYYTKSTGTQAECDAALVVAKCSATTGTFGTLPTTRYSSCAVIQPPVQMGAELYTSKCAACHQALEVSTLKGRNITAGLITNGFTNIAAMNSLVGQLSAAQVDSIVSLFQTTTTTPLVSNFSCPTPEDEKNNNSELIRLTAEELNNTYISILGTTVWNALSTYYYLLPVDEFSGQISNFTKIYSPDYVDQVSRFNEKVAEQIVSTSANLSAFFGTCATATSFTQTCFNTFLNSKGPTIFRSPLATDDATRIWSSIALATSVIDQQKTAIQILLNDPRFLFHIELGDGTAADANGLLALNSYEIANRISYGMTASPPDSLLWADANLNKLKLLANVQAHVDRLAATTAFKNRAINFVKYYIGISKPSAVPSNTVFLNGVNSANLDTAADDEFKEFLNYIIFTSKGKFSDLLNSKASFPKTAALASILGTSVWTTGSVPFSAPNHVGLLTKPYVLLSSSLNTKYVQRGRLVRINMLCTDVPQPSASDLAARPVLTEADLINLTRRQYIDKATLSAASCVACHSKMNEMGYVSGNFDSIGRFVTTEKVFNISDQLVATHPISTISTPKIIDSDATTYSNMLDFQNALSQSDSSQSCLSRRVVQFYNRRVDDITNDTCRLNKIDTIIKSGAPLLDVLTQNFKLQSVLYKRAN